jgi:hypothetical protein
VLSGSSPRTRGRDIGPFEAPGDLRLGGIPGIILPPSAPPSAASRSDITLDLVPIAAFIAGNPWLTTGQQERQRQWFAEVSMLALHLFPKQY